MDYLKSSDQIYLIVKKSAEPSIPDIPKWKEEGNNKFKDGDKEGALEAYSRAIRIFKEQGSQVPAGITRRDIAVLYGKRAATFLSLKKYQGALEDAKMSVDYDKNWYKARVVGKELLGRIGEALVCIGQFLHGKNAAKMEDMGHVHVGCAQRGLGNLEFSLQAFLDALGSLESPESNIQVVILMELAQTYWLLPREKFPLEAKIPKTPFQLLWYRAAYNLIEKDQWDEAHVAYLQAYKNAPEEAHFQVSLKPLCNIEKATKYPWVMQIIQYFIICHSNHQEISCYAGDTYFHAVTYMTVKAGSSANSMSLNLLKYILETFVTKNNEQYLRDKDGNTAYDIVVREHSQDLLFCKQIATMIYDIVIDPLIKNKAGNTAQEVAHGEYFLKDQEQKGQKEMLRTNLEEVPHKKMMKMHAQNLTPTQKKSKKRKDFQPRICQKGTQSQGEGCGTDRTIEPIPSDCNGCQELFKESKQDFKNGDLEKGYHKLIRVLGFKHQCSRHKRIVKKVVTVIVEKLGETSTNDGKAVLAAVSEGHFKVVVELLERGCTLSLVAGDTPIHAAVMIALQRDEGNLTLFETLLCRFDSDPQKFASLNPSRVDAKGDGLFHLLARCEVSSTALQAIKMLCTRNLDPRICNSEGKLPVEYIVNADDQRKQLLSIAGSTEVPTVEWNSSDTVSGVNENAIQINTKDEAKVGVRETVKPSTERRKRKRKIEEMIKLLDIRVLNKLPNGIGPSGGKTEASDKTLSLTMPELDIEMREQDVRPSFEEKEGMGPEDVIDTFAVEAEKGDEDEEESEDEDKEKLEEEIEEIAINASVFNNLLWEVECTSDFLKKLCDKHITPDMKTRIVRRIQLLASGEWQPHLCKKLTNVPLNLQLYESKVSKAGRVIWELAVSFSPRLSEMEEQRLAGEQEGASYPITSRKIYSQIIRVWDIVLDHGKLYRSVKRSAKRTIQSQIIRSYERGLTCCIQKKLSSNASLKTHTNVGHKVPKLFTETNENSLDSLLELQKKQLQKYFPPASPNETDYHIQKFYSFDCVYQFILQNLNTKVSLDLPFRVTDLEHAIIMLKTDAPILIQGRSGTGKTICCLYRLCSQFLSYWIKAKEADAPLLPRTVKYVQKKHCEEEQEKDEEKLEEEKKEEEAKKEDGEEGCKYCEKKMYMESDAGTEDDTVQLNISEESQPGAVGVDVPEDCPQYEHIHQIFVTKSPALCSEVQKKFWEFCKVHDVVRDHFDLKVEKLPCKLQDIDASYPLFLTSKQLLLMLDASIGAPYFFERKRDCSLKVDIQGWLDNDGSPGILSIHDEDSDVEEEDVSDDRDGDIEDEDGDQKTAGTKQIKVDPRREVTYEVFVKEVWPLIKKKMKVNYHPSLIWAEIMSFIKGSYEALSNPCGYLRKDEYIAVGRKRAPSFSGEREKVHKVFTCYNQIKEQKRFFDETDLVHNIFRRLQNIQKIPWVIHQVFVDETQDFTQAELCLLIHICQNPNQMFLTGDTAQSIMRGISFRFEDLKTLFFHAQKSMQAMGNTGAVKTPEQHQLTHNYRSHNGILSLASSVLDLLVEFFPESFDQLVKDQGLFNGPKPVLLESCSFSDLAVLLCGNKRKTSQIEFGAHQVILVVNEAARDSVPEELQHALILTIYEAKGLEFDDVLLYNFFKDSQASKEWRVVTNHLEQLWADSNGVTTTICKNSLVKIDQDMMQKQRRPRPMTFDYNQHKVLNSELKHLYTALTRGRVNVWIFDEDTEKRAPMFDYFKALNLVRCLTLEDLDKSKMTSTVFAERSSAIDWKCRGDYFMKRKLYEAAAKCYGIGGETPKQKVALAHHSALVAGKMRENPLDMKNEFLKAAELFLECSLPDKAAICLENAKERELATQLYEKLGQTEPPRRNIIDPDLVPLDEYEATFERSPRGQKSVSTRSPIAGLTTSPESLPQEFLSTKIVPTGKGLAKSGSGLKNSSNFHVCPDSVVNDVSRLEVLIGGKRAGNNSPEIINEATGICQRLFQNKIMDVHLYRELIDELIDSD